MNMSNDIVQVSTQVPEYMTGADNHSQDVDLSAIKIPMIKAGQPTSEDVTNGKAKFGELYSTVGDNFGDSLEVVIIKPFIDYAKFADKKDPATAGMKGLVAKSNNPTVWESGKFGGQPIGEDAWKYKRYNFYVLPVGTNNSIPYWLSMYSTSGAKTGQALYNSIAMMITKDKVPCYAKTFKLSLVKESNDSGKFAAWKVESTNKFTPAELFKIALEARKFIDANESNIVHDETASQAQSQSIEDNPAQSQQEQY